MKHAEDESLPNERWLPVVGYEGWYDVSNLGRVRRMSKGSGTWIGRIIKGSVAGNGYRRIVLRKDRTIYTCALHGLVATAFIGKCPDGKEVNHKDGIKAHNLATNLEYVTRSENMLHAVRNGMFAAAHGEINGMSKLTEENVHAIRQLIGRKSLASIAKLFDVASVTIGQIATGRTWAWLEEA